MPDTGWLYPSDVTSALPGDSNWTFVDRLESSSDLGETTGDRTTCNMDGDEESYTITAADFGAALPSGATVDGIEVELRMQKGSGSSNRGDIEDLLIELSGPNTSGSSNKAVAGVWSTSIFTRAIGGAADAWNCTLDDSDTNDVSFGFTFQAYESDGRDDSDGYIYWVRMRITYTEASAGGGTTGMFALAA